MLYFTDYVHYFDIINNIISNYSIYMIMAETRCILTVFRLPLIIHQVAIVIYNLNLKFEFFSISQNHL